MKLAVLTIQVLLVVGSLNVVRSNGILDSITDFIPFLKPGGSDQTPCQVEAARSHRLKTFTLSILGGDTPQCDGRGEYLPRQCQSDDGLCWCVNQEGAAITEKGRDTIDCENARTKQNPEIKPEMKPNMNQSEAGKKLTPCREQAGQAAQNEAKHMVGAFHAQCDENGDFKAMQCHGGTGFCWCTNLAGQEITDSIRSTDLNCEEERRKNATVSANNNTVTEKKRTPCQEQAGQASKNEENRMVGGFHPQCDEQGEFKAMQCHGGTGFCWCTNLAGQEITDSVRSTDLNCEDERRKNATVSAKN